jgi:hypothetical protein
MVLQIHAYHFGATGSMESGALLVKFNGTQCTAASRSHNTLALETSFPVRWENTLATMTAKPFIVK